MSNPFEPALMEELLQRELQKERNPLRIRPAEQESLAPVDPLSPSLASLLGGLTDTGSTYAVLKRGTGHEDNKLVAGLAKNPEAMAALGVAANVALPFLLKKLGKKYPKLANTVMASQGALQMGYGSLNTQATLTPRVDSKSEGRNSATQYTSALLAELAKRQR